MERGMVMNKIARIHLEAAHRDQVGEADEAVVVGEDEVVVKAVEVGEGEEGERAKEVEDIRMLLGPGDMIKRCLGWGRYRAEVRFCNTTHYIQSFQHHHYMQYHQSDRRTSLEQGAVLI